MGAATVCATGGPRRPQQQRQRPAGGRQSDKQSSRRASGGPPSPPPPPRQRGSSGAPFQQAPSQRQQRGASDAPSYQQRKNPELYALAAQPSQAAAAAGTGRPGNDSSSGGSTNPAAKPAVVTLPRHKPEVLAPVGGWPQLEAAVQSGADAVYFGLTDFNARARASNFTPEEVGLVGWQGVVEVLWAGGLACRGCTAMQLESHVPFLPCGSALWQLSTAAGAGGDGSSPCMLPLPHN